MGTSSALLSVTAAVLVAETAFSCPADAPGVENGRTCSEPPNRRSTAAFPHVGKVVLLIARYLQPSLVAVWEAHRAT